MSYLLYNYIINENYFSTKFIIFWLFLNVMIAALMDLALFAQTTPSMKKASFLKKVAVAEFWATIEWMFSYSFSTSW